ncbi:MAG: tetratricopeptide repeat protein [Gammaproteobacteria bacterium]|nr:tetratricopeptide repeat protein [Gammaproteobacteria bacterium]
MTVRPDENGSGAEAGIPSEQAGWALQDARWAERNGLPERALAAYATVVGLCPGHVEAHRGMAKLLLDLDRTEEALGAARNALALSPHDALAHAAVGEAFLRLGQGSQAIPHLARALEEKPELHALREQLAGILLDAGRNEEAVALFAGVGARFAGDLAFLVAMAATYRRSGNGALAERAYLELLDLDPQREATYSDLVQLYMDHALYSKARDIVSRALRINPDRPVLWNMLGLAQTSLGLVRESLESFRTVLDLAPNLVVSHSNLLLNMHYSTDTGVEEIAAEHRRWGRMHAPPALAARSFRNDPDPGRPVRIGYVSADFRLHPVAFFFEALLDHRDRDAFEVFCYGQALRPDFVTQRIREKSDRYRDIADMPDRQLADLVLADGIDILVDLGGHAGSSRITLLGYKPAPVQVSYCGYPDTTGIEAVDYRITDALADPAGVEDLYTETLCRLPTSFLCYRPPQPLPELRPPPSQSGRPVTFGSFNRECKLSRETYDMWSRILLAVPESPLILKSFAGGDPEARRLQLAEFASRGVAPERIQCVGFIADHLNHLGGYRNVDVALDAYPYHGTTTTLDALLMSVPVITLAGYNHASRVGVSLLTQLGAQDLIARSAEEYVAVAVDLARSPGRILDLHGTLRERLLASPLCDGRGFMREYEYALRGMWCNWCRRQGAKLTDAQRAMADFDFSPLLNQARDT